MKIIFGLTFLFQFCVGQQDATIHRLSWLTGKWIMTTPRLIIEEEWSPVISNRMEGKGTTLKNGSVISSESIVIDQDSIGRIFYHADPTGQAPASFQLVKYDSLVLVFENMDHDFPHRIIYRKISHDSLYASIEGTVNGKIKSISFPYIKSN